MWLHADPKPVLPWEPSGKAGKEQAQGQFTVHTCGHLNPGVWKLWRGLCKNKQVPM